MVQSRRRCMCMRNGSILRGCNPNNASRPAARKLSVEPSRYLPTILLWKSLPESPPTRTNGPELSHACRHRGSPRVAASASRRCELYCVITPLSGCAAVAMRMRTWSRRKCFPASAYMLSLSTEAMPAGQEYCCVGRRWCLCFQG